MLMLQKLQLSQAEIFHSLIQCKHGNHLYHKPAGWLRLMSDEVRNTEWRDLYSTFFFQVIVFFPGLPPFKSIHNCGSSHNYKSPLKTIWWETLLLKWSKCHLMWQISYCLFEKVGFITGVHLETCLFWKNPCSLITSCTLVCMTGSGCWVISNLAVYSHETLCCKV